MRILVTGANRGLGLELVRTWLAKGHEVWGSARTAEPLELRALGPAGVIRLDLSDEAGIVSGMHSLASQVDGLDLLVNCAGIDARALGVTEDPRGPFDVGADVFTEVIRINATGPMIVTREALPLLRAGNEPMVLNVSSQLGSMEVAATKGRDTSYCVSKAALNMWSVKAAAELRPEGIAVLMLHPGWVSTDMGGPSAQLTPAESASAIAKTIDGLDSSDSGRFINWDGSNHPW
jgi:NAD(P)-dependent dehydrogenase (short-subunit alcohol dehydrogenase family)